ncbi:MAG: 3-phosphoshikimate 1-carboxyvinyltransferase [Caldilineaceae bacterium]
MSQIHLQPGNPLTGACTVPGDKSISHRAVLLGALAEGKSHLRCFLDSADCHATIEALRRLGVTIEELSATELLVHGRGLDGLQEPNDLLDCANSETTLRLLTGLMAGQKFASFLSGSDGLRRLPLGHIIKPLRGMGADIMGRQGGNLAPLGIRPVRLRGLEYEMPVGSAPVKSCLLLAGLYAQGLTILRESGPTRDHTERMLKAMDAPVEIYGRTVHIDRPTEPLKPLEMTIPGDPSLAAFLLVAGAIVPGSRILLPGLCINPMRAGLLHALQEMGATLADQNQRIEGGEPVADLEVGYSNLQGASFGGEWIAGMNDELPALALAATQAKGRTIVRNAAELQSERTDWIATIVSELRKMGAKIEPFDDGFAVDGPVELRGAPVESHDDPRLAMMLTIAGLLAKGPTTLYQSEVIADSFPDFAVVLQALGGNLAVEE